MFVKPNMQQGRGREVRAGANRILRSHTVEFLRAYLPEMQGDACSGYTANSAGYKRQRIDGQI